MTVDLDTLLKFAIPILGGVCSWLWLQLQSAQNTAIANKQDIALMKQSHNSQLGRVDGMEEKIANLSDEITQVKFCLQTLEHKQDKHHIEVLNEIRNIIQQSRTL